MTREKQLLLKDLCARLPYNVVINCSNNDTNYKCFLTTDILHEIQNGYEYYDYKSYLRPLSSVTEEEKKVFVKLKQMSVTVIIPNHATVFRPDYIVDLDDEGDGLNNLYDWLNAHHFDYRGLIPMGLAIEAPEGMYE